MDTTRPLLAAFALLGCLSRPAAGQPAAQSPAFQRAYLDTTCSPCKDFWRFANGAWLDSVQIPPARTQFGRDDLISDRNRAVIRALLDSLAFAPARHARTNADRNVGSFFRECMDTTRAGAELLAPLAPELSRLDRLGSSRDASAAIGRLYRVGVQSLIWFFPASDPDDPTRMIAAIRNLTGTSLPGRQAYLGGDSINQRFRADFVAMLSGIFEKLGDPPDSAGANARRVLEVETGIIRAQPRDSGGTLEKLSLAELTQLAPRFDWNEFAGRDGLGGVRIPLIVMRSAVRLGLDSLMAAVSLEHWRAYLRWRYVRSMAQPLDPAFGGALDRFDARLSGRRGAIPRAVTCVTLTTWRLGDAVARAYVARSFSAADRTRATELVERVRAVFRTRLETLEWLSPATRNRALAKLDAMRLWIGYPDRWEGDHGLRLGAEPVTAQFLAIRQARVDHEFRQIGGRVDPDQWVDANPAFVDLSYYPTSNAILITAAALQPPAFDPNADFLTNLAGIGWGIGHELSHGFDSGGRLHNESGGREDWWTAADAAEFRRRSDLVVRQYDSYVIIDSLRKSGRLTLSENLADIGGAALSYLAFKDATAGQPNDVVDGYTREQRFFIALAQSYPRIATRPEQLRLDAQDQDGHHVPRWRLNGALANLAAFAAAFGCKEGDPMVLSAALRGSIW